MADSAKGFLLIGATYVMVLMLALIVVFGILMNIGTSQFGQALLGFVIPALVLWSLMGLGLMRIAHRKAR